MSSPSGRFVVSEIPNREWSIEHTLVHPIDTAGRTAGDWLRSIGVDYKMGDVPGADLYVEKESFEKVRMRTLAKRAYLLVRRSLRPTVVIIGEPYEYSKLAYWFCSPRNTLAVAPGHRFERLYYATDRPDATLDGWDQRLDRIVWVARPYPWRLEFARKALAAGIPLDVYSRYDWGLPCWKGPSDDLHATLSAYRYAIAGENFSTHGCHTEKLNNALMAGCVPFYDCDPTLDIPEVRGTWAAMTLENMANREALARTIRPRQKEFFESKQRLIYTPHFFWAKILRKGLQGREDRYPDLVRALQGF